MPKDPHEALKHAFHSMDMYMEDKEVNELIEHLYNLGYELTKTPEWRS